MSNFKFSYVGLLNVGVAVFFAALAVYGASSLTPISTIDKNSSKPQIAGAVTSVAQSETGGFVVFGQKPVSFLGIDSTSQVVQVGDNARVHTKLSVSGNSNHQILNIYNPNFADTEVYISVKVPSNVKQAVVIDLIDAAEKKQLFAPELPTLPVVKVKVPAQGNYVLTVNETWLEQANFEAELTYFVNSVF